MGQCSSCLGFRKEDPDHPRLLPSDYPSQSHGTFDYAQRMGMSHGHHGLGGRGVGEIDPQDQIREREALERIVTNASMNLIDIFALAPQHHHTGTSTPSHSQTSSHPHSHQQAPRGKSGSAPPLRREMSTGSMGGIGGMYGGHDAKKMAVYRALLQKTSPPQLPQLPEVLPPGAVNDEERRWLEEIGERAEEAVGVLTRVKGVGRVVVGLEVMGQ
ncbi:hypothetical protein L211DRAFT_848006 [Terfezia boudieri ATCC MYA-4762]|uniref:Late endosomal/lysosomal adaptor and MAPK and MTOR activator-domain-containing protein n=1 Tax=Terfezia boudieri ATCC MYA-4762 TaxID=1051890 RepID=A0A3N4LWX8_9PEZI|nr:hypothetical protein L211DRAFT_848006 [Terfezia boudieri ATCC MYA-4762]